MSLQFLPVELVLHRNQAEGMSTIAEALAEKPGYVALWNSNRVAFDYIEIVRRDASRYGWIVRNAPARWSLEAA